MNVLIVGGAGYIGSHCVRQVQLAGHRPVVLDNLVFGHRQAVSPEVKFYQCDLGDRETVGKVLRDEEIELVMHFAAFIEVGESVTAPLKYYRNNVSATATLLSAMVRHNITRFIFSSSAAVYGDPVYTPIDEKHPLRPTSPYGETKQVVEGMLKACDAAYGLRSICLRYFNAAGADPSGKIGENHQPESHLIPLILQVASGHRDSISIFGTDYPTPDGTCVRDYIHVNDLASAHLLALESRMTGDQSGIYNLGNGQGFSVHEVIESARNITRHPIPVKEAPRRPGDPAVLIASSDRIMDDLNWQPRYGNLDEIIHTAWQWHNQI